MKQENENFKFEATPVIDLKRAPIADNWDNEKTEVFIEDEGGAAGAFLMNSEGEYIPISAFPFVIGRGNECDLVLNGKGISRKHVEIVFQSGRFVVNDLDSLNGLKVNGYKVARVILEEGDSIKLGEINLVFTSSREKNASVQNSANSLSSDKRVEAKTVTGNLSGSDSQGKKKILIGAAAAVSVTLLAGVFFLQGTNRNVVDQRVVVVPNPAPSTTTQENASPEAQVVGETVSPEPGTAQSSDRGGVPPSSTMDSNDPPPSIALSVSPKTVDTIPPPSPPSDKPKTVAPISKSKSVVRTEASVKAEPSVKTVTAAPLPTASKSAVVQANVAAPVGALDNRYLSGDVDSLLKEMSQNLKSGAATDPGYKAKYEKYLALFNSYSAGKQASIEGRREEEVRLWSDFLLQEKSYFGDRRSTMGRNASAKLSDDLTAIGNEAAKSGKSQDAYKNWQKALTYGDSVAARIAIDAANQKSQQLYRQALRLEYVNADRAKELWREVLTLVPPGTEYYTKASSKLAWYDKWGS